MQIKAHPNLHETSVFLAHHLHILKCVFCILVRGDPLEMGNVEQYQRAENITADKDEWFIH